MPMPTNDTARESATAATTERSFICEVGENDAIEIRISIVSVPLVSPPPRPRQFEFAHALRAGGRFVIRGELDDARAVPLVNPPPGNQN